MKQRKIATIKTETRWVDIIARQEYSQERTVEEETRDSSGNVIYPLLQGVEAYVRRIMREQQEWKFSGE